MLLNVCISKVTFGSQALPKTYELKNICKPLPLTSESLDSGGLYVFDDGFRFVIWFGKMLSPNIAMNLLGDDFTTDYSRVCFFYYYYTHESLKNQCIVVNKNPYKQKNNKDIVVDVICEFFQDIMFDVKTEMKAFSFYTWSEHA